MAEVVLSLFRVQATRLNLVAMLFAILKMYTNSDGIVRVVFFPNKYSTILEPVHISQAN